MLCLTDEIGRDNGRIRTLVGEDQTVGGAGEHIDADPPEEDPFGLGDELIAGADQNIGCRQPEQSKGHGCNALHAAEREDRIGAAQVGGVNDCRVDADLRTRRRAG